MCSVHKFNRFSYDNIYIQCVVIYFYRQVTLRGMYSCVRNLLVAVPLQIEDEF